MSFPNFDRYFNQANSSQSLDAYDNTFKIVDRTDPTKQVEFDVSSLTTNTRRTKTYDNLIFSRTATSEYTGRWGVLDLQETCREVSEAVTAQASSVRMPPSDA